MILPKNAWFSLSELRLLKQVTADTLTAAAWGHTFFFGRKFTNLEILKLVIFGNFISLSEVFSEILKISRKLMKHMKQNAVGVFKPTIMYRYGAVGL